VAAQAQLGIAFRKGYCVPQNDAIAMSWFHKAADQGDAFAQAAVGSMYDLGKGVAQDYTEAAKWFRMAASVTFGTQQQKIGC
jgi:TPR repeat protein